jgi:hypothetical protein
MATLDFTLRQYYDWCKDYPLVIHDFAYVNNFVVVQIKISILEQLYSSGYISMK